MLAKPSLLALLALLAGAAAGAGCSVPPNHEGPFPEMPMPAPPDPDSLAFTVLDEGQHAAEAPAHLVIRADSAWAPLRERLRLTTGPAVDEEVLEGAALFYAAVQAHSGGHRLRFERIYREDGGTAALYVVEVPGAGCLTTRALTQPYQLVRVTPPPSDPVRFEERREVYACDGTDAAGGRSGGGSGGG
ncbi:MAG: protease complex subunit PrcB family protein [Rhodothermales bacterium]|nr:protease complex subunit PrcB family protein [Rhodothermales bacterium]